MPTRKEALEARRKRATSTHFHIEPAPGEVPAYTVDSASGGSYRVLLPAFPSRDGAQCSCPDFLSRGLGTCKHLEAALAYAALNPPPPRPAAPVAPFPWMELERATGALLQEADAKGWSATETVRQMRRLGAGFLETPASATAREEK